MTVRRSILVLITLTAIAFGCASQPAMPPSAVPKIVGDNVVLILYHDSYFNMTLKDKVSAWCVGRGYKVMADEEFQADRYSAAEYAAVVFMAKYEAKGSMKIVDAFVSKYAKRGNTVVAISHEWNMEGSEIKKPYDALTAASKDFEQEDIFAAITGRLGGILKK